MYHLAELLSNKVDRIQANGQRYRTSFKSSASDPLLSSSRQTLELLCFPSEESASKLNDNRQEDLTLLVQDYFEKMGNLRVEHDRLSSLRSEHVEARAERILQVEPHKSLDLTDEHFENAFEEKYALALWSVDHAVKMVEWLAPRFRTMHLT